MENPVSFMRIEAGRKSAYLVATGELAGMHPLALLSFADAVGGGCVGDRHGDVGLWAAAHSVLAANHAG